MDGLGPDNAKLPEILWHMARHNIAVLCLQETHTQGSQYYYSDGFLIILSGGTGHAGSKLYSGVGLVIAPWAVKAVIGSKLINNRLAVLRLKVSGGMLNVVSAYAPHSGYPCEIRKAFFDNFGTAWPRPTAHTDTVAFGDFNAKLFGQLPGDEDVIGRFVFKSPLRADLATTNRELLLETCRALGCVVANTFFEHDQDKLVTYCSPGVAPTDRISAETFAQIDHCVCEPRAAERIEDIWSDRASSLQTRHFLLQAHLKVSFATTTAKPAVPKCNLPLLRVEGNATTRFRTSFCEQMESFGSGSNLDEHAANIARAMRAASAVITCPSQATARRPWISLEPYL